MNKLMKYFICNKCNHRYKECPDTCISVINRKLIYSTLDYEYPEPSKNLTPEQIERYNELIVENIYEKYEHHVTPWYNDIPCGCKKFTIETVKETKTSNYLWVNDMGHNLIEKIEITFG